MTSSNPGIVRPLRDGVVTRASYVLDPRDGSNPQNNDLQRDLQSQLYAMCYQGGMFILFLSILLGDNQILHEGIMGNKRVKGRDVWSGTDCETMHLHGGEWGGELANPTTILWLPEYLKDREAILGYKTAEDFLNAMKMVFMEVMKFGVKATDVAKGLAKMEFYLVQHVLFNVKDLRVALQAIAKDMETELPLIDPLLPHIEPSGGYLPGASYILVPQPLGVDSNLGGFAYQLSSKFYDSKQFYIFISILLGEDHLSQEDAIVHNNGSALSGIDHDSLQLHGGELVAPMTSIWLPEYLKKRDAILGYTNSHCWQELIKLFHEVMKFGARTTSVARAFAKMEIDHVEYLLKHPEDLQATLQQLNTTIEDQDTRELIKLFMPDLEFDLPLDVLLDAELLPDIEPIDDGYIKLVVFTYFGKPEGKQP